MVCSCFGTLQYDCDCSRLAVGGHAVWAAILFDMDLLRLAKNRATVEIHKYYIFGALHLWNRSVFYAGCLNRQLSPDPSHVKLYSGSLTTRCFEFTFNEKGPPQM